MYGNCLALLGEDRPDGPGRATRGMSLFLVNRADGYDVVRKLGKLGYRGVDTAELLFDDVLVAADQLLGGDEGQGFIQTVGALELGRINVAARGLGVADRRS